MAKQENNKKNREGRPLLWESPEELQKKIDEYFDSCFRPLINTKTNEIVKDANGNEIMQQFRPFTISGLALALDTSRQTLINYQERDEFFDTIMRAKRKCENYTEEMLFHKDSANGAKFVLLNGYEKWKDKQEIELDVKKLFLDV